MDGPLPFISVQPPAGDPNGGGGGTAAKEAKGKGKGKKDAAAGPGGRQLKLHEEACEALKKIKGDVAVRRRPPPARAGRRSLTAPRRQSLLATSPAAPAGGEHCRCVPFSGPFQHAGGGDPDRVLLPWKALFPIASGLYRTGKSYILNQLAGSPNGFGIGSTIGPSGRGRVGLRGTALLTPGGPCCAGRRAAARMQSRAPRASGSGL